MVKFQNIDPKILKQVQDEEKMDSEASESESESKSDDNDNGGLTAAESAYTGPPGNSLIKIDVDITSPSLRDLLSDKPVVAERSEQSAVAPKPPQSASIEEDID